MLIGLDASRFQLERFNIGCAPDGPDYAIETGIFTAILAMQGELAVFTHHPGDFGARQYFDAVFEHGFHQHFTQHCIELIEKVAFAQHERYLTAQCVQHARQLNGDVTGTDDGHAFGLLFQFKKTV